MKNLKKIKKDGKTIITYTLTLSEIFGSQENADAFLKMMNDVCSNPYKPDLSFLNKFYQPERLNEKTHENEKR